MPHHLTHGALGLHDSPPNGISIGSAVLQENRQTCIQTTERATRVAICRICALLVVRPMVCLRWMYVESGFGGGVADDQLSSRKSHRLHQAVYEPRHQHSVQATVAAKSRPLLLPQSSRHRDLGLRRRRLPGSVNSRPILRNL